MNIGVLFAAEPDLASAVHESLVAVGVEDFAWDVFDCAEGDGAALQVPDAGHLLDDVCVLFAALDGEA